MKRVLLFLSSLWCVCSMAHIPEGFTKKCAELLLSVVPGHALVGKTHEGRNYGAALAGLATEDGTPPAIGTAAQVEFGHGTRRGKVAVGIVVVAGSADEPMKEHKEMRDGVRRIFSVTAERVARYAVDPQLATDDGSLINNAVNFHPLEASGCLSAKQVLKKFDEMMAYLEDHRHPRARLTFQPLHGVAEVIIRLNKNATLARVDREGDALVVTFPEIHRSERFRDDEFYNRIRIFMSEHLEGHEGLRPSWEAPFQRVSEPSDWQSKALQPLFTKHPSALVDKFGSDFSPADIVRRFAKAMQEMMSRSHSFILTAKVDYRWVTLAVGIAEEEQIFELGRSVAAYVSRDQAMRWAHTPNGDDPTSIAKMFHFFDTLSGPEGGLERWRPKFAAELIFDLLRRGRAIAEIRKSVLCHQRLEAGLERWLNVAEEVQLQFAARRTLDVPRLEAVHGVPMLPGSFAEKLRAPETMVWLSPLLGQPTATDYVAWVHQVPVERIGRLLDFYERLAQAKRPYEFDQFILKGLTGDRTDHQRLDRTEAT